MKIRLKFENLTKFWILSIFGDPDGDSNSEHIRAYLNTCKAQLLAHYLCNLPFEYTGGKYLTKGVNTAPHDGVFKLLQ